MGGEPGIVRAAVAAALGAHPQQHLRADRVAQAWRAGRRHTFGGQAWRSSIEVDEGGFGNMVRAPMGGRPEFTGRTLFGVGGPSVPAVPLDAKIRPRGAKELRSRQASYDVEPFHCLHATCHNAEFIRHKVQATRPRMYDTW